MNQVVSAQTILFMTSVEIGILMGMFFDLIRILRKIVKHPNFLVQIQDMLYWIICSFVSFYLLYICNYAEIRPFIFIGILLGATIYFLTLSIIFMKIATLIIHYLKMLIGKIIRIILIPLKALIKVIKVPIRYISKKWHHFLYLNKLRYRQYRRIKYEQKADKKVEHYLKHANLDLHKRKV